MKVDHRRYSNRRDYMLNWRPRGGHHRWRDPISERTKRMIRGAVAEGESLAEVARGYGISYDSACRIMHEATA